MISHSFTVFDTETTGLDPKKGHRVVELAAVRVEDGIIREDKTFTSLINPERNIPFEVQQIHHLTDDDVKDAPTMMEVLPQFLEFAQGSTLIAHNAAFDMDFLLSEKEYCWGYIELPECLCTMRLSQSLYPTAFRHNLDILAQKFEFPIPPPGERHRALPDVLLTANVLLRMIEDGKIQSMDELKTKAGLLKAAVA